MKKSQSVVDAHLKGALKISKAGRAEMEEAKLCSRSAHQEIHVLEVVQEAKDAWGVRADLVANVEEAGRVAGVANDETKHPKMTFGNSLGNSLFLFRNLVIFPPNFPISLILNSICLDVSLS